MHYIGLGRRLQPPADGIDADDQRQTQNQGKLVEIRKILAGIKQAQLPQLRLFGGGKQGDILLLKGFAVDRLIIFHTLLNRQLFNRLGGQRLNRLRHRHKTNPHHENQEDGLPNRIGHGQATAFVALLKEFRESQQAQAPIPFCGKEQNRQRKKVGENGLHDARHAHLLHHRCRRRGRLRRSGLAKHSERCDNLSKLPTTHEVVFLVVNLLHRPIADVEDGGEVDKDDDDVRYVQSKNKHEYSP